MFLQRITKADQVNHRWKAPQPITKATSAIHTPEPPTCAKLEEMQKKHSAPDGEVLKILGLGEWKS